MKQTAVAGLKIDVLVDSEHWKNAATAKIVVRRALKQAATRLSTRPAELAIVLTDDSAMRRLNRNWRGVDAPTNVLSFATKNPGDQLHEQRGSHPVGNHLGDIVLAYETVKHAAHREGKPFDHHLAHLVVHGFLHLLGYDHENDAEARRMEAAERAILRDLAVPDPYRAAYTTAGHAGRRPAKRVGRDRARAGQNA
jgi:probable rRNA maturation factor